MKKAILAFAILSGLFFINYTQASLEVKNSGEELKLYLGQPETLSVNNPTRIAIGNPEIADVSTVSAAEIIIMPKAAGATTLVYWDNFGEQSYKIKVFAENIDEAKRRIDNLLNKLDLPSVYTKAEEDEGKVLLLGAVKTSQDREKISLILGPLTAKTIDLLKIKEEEAGIEIDVQVLELSKDATNTLGLTWPSAVNLAEAGSPGIASAGTKWSTVFKVLNLERATVSGSTYTASPFTFKLDALIQEGKARVLSRPKLACQSGKEAELMVGGEKPIFTTTVASAGGSGTSVEYKEYGLKLKIKPTVTEENRIKVSLNVEISEIGAADSIGSGTETTAKAYPLTKRNVSTELYLDDGQTLAIGGLIKQKQEEDIKRVPFLSKVPLFGNFFKETTSKTGGGTGERGNTELFITLTPTILGIKPEAVKEEKIIVTSSMVATSVDESLPLPVKNYTTIIQKRILDNLNYPLSAKEAGFQGTVKLRLRLSYLGQLIDAQVKDSSGYRILDDNAVEVAQRLTSFPPFPAAIEQKELWVEIPIVYRLD